MGGPQSSLSGRQDAAGQNTFSDSKFSAAADSTSSPVPSSVGNTVGQQPAFNLGELELLWVLFQVDTDSFIAQLQHSLLQLPSIPLCRQVTPISTAEWAACPASSTEGAWLGAESTLVSILASQCPQLLAPHPPANSRTQPMERGKDDRIVGQ